MGPSGRGCRHGGKTELSVGAATQVGCQGYLALGGALTGVLCTPSVRKSVGSCGPGVSGDVGGCLSWAWLGGAFLSLGWER